MVSGNILTNGTLTNAVSGNILTNGTLTNAVSTNEYGILKNAIPGNILTLTKAVTYNILTTQSKYQRLTYRCSIEVDGVRVRVLYRYPELNRSNPTPPNPTPPIITTPRFLFRTSGSACSRICQSLPGSSSSPSSRSGHTDRQTDRRAVPYLRASTDNPTSVGHREVAAMVERQRCVFRLMVELDL